MTPRARQIFEPVTMGHVRSHGCRELHIDLVATTGPSSMPTGYPMMGGNVRIERLVEEIQRLRLRPQRLQRRLDRQHRKRRGVNEEDAVWACLLRFICKTGRTQRARVPSK